MNRLLAGVLASFTAEVVFTAMVALVREMRNLDPWKAVKMPASFLIGPQAVHPPGFATADVLLGALAHATFAAAVGIAFALLLPHLGLAPLMGGLVTAALLYLFGFWILPQAFPEWLAPFWLPPTGRALQAVAHTAYGVVLGLTYARLSQAGKPARREQRD